MENLGNIEYNALGSDFLEIYPQLANGYINFTFATENETYTMLIYYNVRAECLFFNIYNSSNEPIQNGCVLAEYPNNLLCAMELREYALYMKDYTLYFGLKNEDI